MPTDAEIRNVINAVVVPLVDRPLQDVGRVADLKLEGNTVSAAVELGIPAAGVEGALADAVGTAVNELPDIETVNCDVRAKIVAHGVQRNLKPLPQVKNVIAVASGKGGVGKSTTAVNLALALQADGAQVGVLDADIYGPSIPTMLGVAGQNPTSDDGNSMNPLTAHGLQVMSIGFLIDTDQPMAWRGPMVTQALSQMLKQTTWENLDYLIVDMPPGTGDIQLTLSQQVPVSGAVIVTTPQDIALLDARKGLQMFRKVSIPVLGIVENMSTHVCTSCGHEEPIFGSGGGAGMAEQYKVELLGQLPLALAIREQTDGGTPTVVAEPDGTATAAYRSAALRMAAELSTRGRDYSSKFPNIVVENT